MGKRSKPRGTVAPTQAIKGIGRLGQVDNNLNPSVVKTPLKGGPLTSALLGRQGKP